MPEGSRSPPPVDLQNARRLALETTVRNSIDRGDHRGALVHLMNGYGSQVLRFCHRVLSDAELAQDVRQIVFIQAYEGLRSFAGRSTLRSWLFGIARHRCLDTLQSSRRRVRREQQSGVAVDLEAAAPDQQERWRIQQGVLTCLGRLSPAVRSTVLLRCQDGFTFPELAQMLDERPGTLQARVARATTALQRCLSRHEVQP